MADKVRVGVVGCARFAMRTLFQELATHPEIKLVAVASRDPAKAAEMANQFGCRAMDYSSLADSSEVDAVYIPLPNALHAEWVGRCLKQNKHVLCEKSLGCTWEEVRQMVDLARSRNLFLMENFQFRFHSQHAHAKELIQSGRLGRIRCFRASFGFPPLPDGAENIRYKASLGGGALLDAGAYTLKATTFMMGKGFRVKAASLRRSEVWGVDVGGGIFLENDEGLISETAFGFDHFYQCNYEIWGSEGYLRMNRAYTAPPGFSPTMVIETKAGVETISLPSDNHFSHMLSYFSEGVRNGRDREAEYVESLIQADLLQQVWKKA